MEIPASNNIFPKIIFGELTEAPATPAAGTAIIYRLDDGKYYAKDSAGDETELGTGSSGGGGTTSTPLDAFAFTLTGDELEYYAEGGTINIWVTKKGFPFSPGEVSNCGTVQKANLNGKNIARFANKRGVIANIPGIHAGAWSWFAVIKFTAESSTENGFLAIGITHRVFRGSNGRLGVVVADVGATQEPTVSMSLNTWGILTGTNQSGSTPKLWVNGVSRTLPTITNTHSTKQLSISLCEGWNASGFHANADIAAIGVTGGVMPDANRIALESYLATLFGLTI